MNKSITIDSARFSWHSYMGLHQGRIKVSFQGDFRVYKDITIEVVSSETSEVKKFEYIKCTISSAIFVAKTNNKIFLIISSEITET